MEARVAVHLVLICVFGQIHSAKFKIERYSAEDSVGVMVSYGATNENTKIEKFTLRSSGPICLKHMEKIQIYYPSTSEKKLDLKLFFKVDDKKYEMKTTYEHGIEIDENSQACFLLGTWRFPRQNAGEKLEIFITYLSKVNSIGYREVVNLILNLKDTEIESFMQVSKDANNKADSKDLSSAKTSKSSSKVLKNIIKNYDSKEQSIIGYLACSRRKDEIINFSIDSTIFVQKEIGELKLTFYNKKITKESEELAVKKLISSSSTMFFENEFGFLSCQYLNNFYVKSKYLLSEKDKPIGSDGFVFDNYDYQDAKNSNSENLPSNNEKSNVGNANNVNQVI